MNRHAVSIYQAIVCNFPPLIRSNIDGSNIDDCKIDGESDS